MKFFRKKGADQEEGEQLTGRGGSGIARFTIGAALNLLISLDFLALMLTSVVVIGTVGTVQHDLASDKNYNNQSTVCYFFSSCSNPSCSGFTPGASHACDASMVGFAFVVVLALAFIISLIVKAVLHHE